MISFGLNHMAVRGLDVGAFCALASSLGCTGVEIRQDTSHEKFTDELAKKIAGSASENGLNVIAVSEIGAFDDFDDQKRPTRSVDYVAVKEPHILERFGAVCYDGQRYASA